MYEATFKLQLKANRGSSSALAELNNRKENIIVTGLTGIHNEDIIMIYTDDIKDKLDYINKTVKNIDTNKSILKKSIIIDAFTSATIEGARTTVNEVIKILESNSATINKSNQMVLNTIKACNKACNNEISLDNIRSIWEIITYNVCENEHVKGNKFRSGMVYIGSTTKIVHVPCPVELIDGKMKEMFIWSRESLINSIIKSCLLHFYVAYIHPFCDGNGRLARLLNSSYLIHNGYANIKYVSLSESINNELPMYYKTLEDSEYIYNNTLDVTPFIDYMIDIICNSIDNTISKYNKLNDMQIKILNKMKDKGKHSEITVENACKITKIDRDRTRQELNKLVEMGYLTKYKSSKINIYVLN